MEIEQGGFKYQFDFSKNSNLPDRATEEGGVHIVTEEKQKTFIGLNDTKRTSTYYELTIDTEPYQKKGDTENYWTDHFILYANPEIKSSEEERVEAEVRFYLKHCQEQKVAPKIIEQRKSQKEEAPVILRGPIESYSHKME